MGFILGAVAMGGLGIAFLIISIYFFRKKTWLIQNCHETADGVVVKFKSSRDGVYAIMEYDVDGVKYQIRYSGRPPEAFFEPFTKLWYNPNTRKTIPIRVVPNRISDLLGRQVTVKYCKGNPKRSYIADDRRSGYKFPGFLFLFTGILCLGLIYPFLIVR